MSAWRIFAGIRTVLCYNRRMNIMITDTGTTPVRPNRTDIVLRDGENMEMCRGCAGCWTRTPGVCVIPDRLRHFGALLSHCDNLIIVSRCVSGSVSPFVMRVLERARPFLLPQTDRAGRHLPRYAHRMVLSVYFYGEEDAEGQACAREMTAALCRELHARTGSVIFLRDAAEIGGC